MAAKNAEADNQKQGSGGNPGGSSKGSGKKEPGRKAVINRNARPQSCLPDEQLGNSSLLSSQPRSLQVPLGVTF
jgi:hypothetical protein